EEHDESVLRREIDHRVHSGEVVLVRLREVSWSGKRKDAIVSAAVGTSAGVGGTEEVDPHEVETVGLTVGEERIGFGLREVHHQCLRRITGDQEGYVVLIDEVATVGTDLQEVVKTWRRAAERLESDKLHDPGCTLLRGRGLIGVRLGRV